MKAISRWFAVVGVSAALATCFVAQTAATPGGPGRASAGPPLALPRDLPADVHMPASGYSIQTIFADVNVGLRSPAPLGDLFAQYANTMKSAGWQEKSETRGEHGAELDFTNGIREINIGFDYRRHEHATDIRLHVHCRRQIGDRETCDDLASDLPAPTPDIQIVTPQHQTATMEVKTNASKEVLFAEYAQAMPAAGWEASEQSKRPFESEQYFRKNGVKIRVHLMQSPDQGAAHLDMDVGVGS